MRKIPKTLNFKSKLAYRKWAAYGNIHGLFKKAPGFKKIKIRGKLHSVKHKK